ncbi:TetR/AcrR family transcriptional regulator [Devosia sp. Leaf64]|jgi:AcrR family transcriptional regulator|uniref:TetR/AcrR family transcriptional regulator n=1 Tax=Devosia sp. Leaf64 TaxID=1736229 RepID=UPI00071410BF|nr:TetR/AcrR family transcriptional regulator [Devosia sp. Leaf64]KQN74885.1 hypothetical protein ASE94_00715 [Devosia sp. Leaf64]
MDARLERSRGAILDAVIELLDAGPLSGLSITQVATKAAVTRPTFYQHFPDLAAAARAAAFMRLDEALAHSEENEELAGEALRAHIEKAALEIFAYLAQHRTFFVRVMEEAGNASFFDDLVSLTGTRLVPGHIAPSEASSVYAQTVNRFFAGGLSWLAINWLRTEPVEPAEKLAQRIATLVSTLSFEGR